MSPHATIGYGHRIESEAWSGGSNSAAVPPGRQTAVPANGETERLDERAWTPGRAVPEGASMLPCPLRG